MHPESCSCRFRRPRAVVYVRARVSTEKGIAERHICRCGHGLENADEVCPKAFLCPSAQLEAS
eukprot:6407369-Prorocentrum_lima.AAC.1